MTSSEVIGSPSDHFASSIRLKVTVLRSSETSQLSAMPGARRQVLGVEVDEQVPVERPDRVLLLVRRRRTGSASSGPAPSRSAGRSSRRRIVLRAPAGSARPRAPAPRSPPAPPTRPDRPQPHRDLLLVVCRSARPPPRAPRASLPPPSIRDRRPRAASSPCACRGRPGTFAIAGIPSGAISSSRISSIESVDSGPSGSVWRLQVDVGAEDEAGGVVELAGADQVVERRVDQVRLGVQVLDHHARSRRSAPRTGVPMLAHSSVRQPPTSGASADALADGEHVGVLGVLEHPPERLGLEGAVKPLLGLLGQLLPCAG